MSDRIEELLVWDVMKTWPQTAQVFTWYGIARAPGTALAAMTVNDAALI